MISSRGVREFNTRLRQSRQLVCGFSSSLIPVAFLNHMAFIKNINKVTLQYLGNVVSDYDRRLTFTPFTYRIHHLYLISIVQSTCCFVQDQDRGVTKASLAIATLFFSPPLMALPPAPTRVSRPSGSSDIVSVNAAVATHRLISSLRTFS